MAQKGTVHLVVSGITEPAGTLRAGIFDNPEDFREKENPKYGNSIEVADTLESILFPDIDFGKYAIAIYHDQNDDSRLNTRKLGIPSEGVGFSGVSKSKLKPPDFETAAFNFDTDTTIRIELTYPKKE